MKQFFVTVLFFVLTAPFLVPFASLRYEKYQTRRTVKKRLLSGIDKSELVYFKFSNQEVETLLDWEHEKEFEYGARMYDVVFTKATKDSVTYWCWEDSEETRLNQRLTSLVWKALLSNPQHREEEKVLSSFFKLYYFPHTFIWELAPFRASQSMHIYYEIKDYDTESPPLFWPPETV